MKRFIDIIKSKNPSRLFLFKAGDSKVPSKEDSRPNRNHRTRFPNNYKLLENDTILNALFDRLRARIFKKAKEDNDKHLNGSPKLRMEYGSLAVNRPFFYLDPWEDLGWLFERNPTGWIISRADWIVHQKTFLREEAWDAVNIFIPENSPLSMPRISSKRLPNNLMSFFLYEEALLDMLKRGNLFE